MCVCVCVYVSVCGDVCVGALIVLALAGPSVVSVFISISWVKCHEYCYLPKPTSVMSNR